MIFMIDDSFLLRYELDDEFLQTWKDERVSFLLLKKYIFSKLILIFFYCIIITL